MSRRFVAPAVIALVLVGGTGLLHLLRGGDPTGAAAGVSGGCEGGEGMESVAEPIAATPEEMVPLLEGWSQVALSELAPGLLGPGEGELQVTGLAVDRESIGHVRFQQSYQGVRVFGGEVVAHLWPDGRMRGLTDHLLRDLEVSTTPAVPEPDAVTEAIRESVADRDLLTAEPEVDLWVWRGPRRDHLVYRVELERLDGSAASTRPVLFIDAQDGDIVWRYENLQDGPGQGHHRQGVDLETVQVASSYYLEHSGHAQSTVTFQDTVDSAAWLVDDDDVWNAPAQRSGVDVHWSMDQAQRVFEGPLGFSFDALPHPLAAVSGGPDTLVAIVDYGEDYNNAFWSNPYLVFGNGDGDRFGPLTSLDVVAHELTHAVVEASAGLVYADESGALNESWADVFGALVEHAVDGPSPHVWTIGEDCYTPSVDDDALRYMSDPTADGSSRDHYDERYTGVMDNGGVHWNSGIANLAFYLLAEGGEPPGGGTAVDGIGIDEAAAIWLQALTAYLTSESTFEDARTATLRAPADLYGASAAESSAVVLAWSHVGVGDPPGTDDPRPDADRQGPCASYDTVLTGALSGQGDMLQLNEAPYFVDRPGLHEGCLQGRRGTDFELVLLKFVAGTWRRVASDPEPGSLETVSYEGEPGYYTWAARSRSGAGRLVVGFSTP